MSFPNPDNYARDCDCGPGNTTPAPATILSEIDSRIATHTADTTAVHGISNTSNLEFITNKNQVNGYAGLGADGKIALSQLPDANALEFEAIAYAIALGM